MRFPSPFRGPCVRVAVPWAVMAFTLLMVAGPAVSAGHLSGQMETHPVVSGHHTANYDLAARFAPYKLRELIHSTMVDPRWIEGSQKFWYEWEDTNGKTFYIVDPSSGSKRPVFDNDRLAAELTRITRDPYDGQHLPIRSIRFIDENTIQFDVTSSQDEEKEEAEKEEEEEQEEEEKGPPAKKKTDKKVFHFEFDIPSQTLRLLEDYEAPDNHPGWASVSPDGETVVFVRDYNLYMMTGESYQEILDARRGKSGEEADSLDQKVEVEEIQLTEDGEEHYSYGYSGRGDTDKEKEEKAHWRKRAPAYWSHDSERFALVRQDRREVEDLWVIHYTGNERMELETYKYDMPGEENVTQNEIWIYDLESRSKVKVQDDPWKDQDMSIPGARQFNYPDSEEPRRSLWLSPSADELHFIRQSRDRHRIDLMVADAATGEARPLIEERLNTYQEVRTPERLENGDIIWWSERDGWAHLYRYGAEGTLKNRLTSGPWHVDNLLGVDENRGFAFLIGNAREEEEDPYYMHLYRVGLDGSGLRLLNPGDFDHRVAMSESNRYFVENYSRVDTVPASALMDADGRKILDLEEADFSALMAAGYQFPEPYKVKAADGITDIYGVMYKPFDFDPEKRYPIVTYVYPGPQTESVAKAFSSSPYEVGLAQFGMVVVTIGNRGGHPDRSKWYHNYGYGNLRDYGLADKKAGLEQLADRHDFIDLHRVGIYGHSGGGFMSTAAMLVYPDFFKVAVSSSGNHTNDVYNRWWSETHHGVKEVVDDEGEVSFEYSIATNPQIAKNLKGHLLLTTGDIDNNVHPANTYRMAEALIKANKRFDFFLFPGQRHGYGNMGDYWFWLRAEYFVKHLLGDARWNADILPLQVEQPKTR
ncbi:MAG: DPP IV N-terminal domain-containing protein [Longimicrobiales bacterium]